MSRVWPLTNQSILSQCQLRSVQLSSGLVKMASMWVGKSISTPSWYSEVMLMSCLKNVSVLVWLTMTMSCPFRVDCWLLPFSIPHLRNQCHVLGFVPIWSVSNSSKLQIFHDTSHLWGFLCLPLWSQSFLLDFSMSRTVDPESWKMDVEHYHICVPSIPQEKICEFNVHHSLLHHRSWSC